MLKATLTIFLLLFSMPALADVALDGTCTVNEPAACTNCDVTHTITAGTFLLAFVGIDDPTATATSATWDYGGSAQAMTSLADWAVGGDGRGAAYKLVSPTTGAKTLRIVLSGSKSPHVVICAFTGVNLADPHATVVESEVNTGSNSGSSLAFTPTTGGMAVSYLVLASVPAGFANGADQTPITTNPDTFNGGLAQGAAATATLFSPLDYTWTAGFRDHWQVVVPLNAESGGGSAGVTLYAGLGGSDSNSCTAAQTVGTRKLTWASVKGCITANTTTTVRFVSGSNFTEALTLVGLTGTASNPITIMANSGPGTVTFTAQYIAGSSCRSLITGGGQVNSWITLQDMTWNGSGCPDEAGLVGNRLDGVTNFTMRGIEIKAFRRTALYIAFNSTNVLIENSNFHDQVSPTCDSGSRYYGIYAHDATNLTIRNSIFSGNPGGGLQIYPGPLTNITVTNNQIFGNSECPGGQGVGGIIVATDSAGGNISGVTIAHNVIYGNGSGVTGQNGGGIRAYATGGRTLTGLQIVNNTIYNNQTLTGAAYGINIQAGPSGAIIKNNIVLANESGQIVDAGTGTVSTTNKTTGTITDCTVSTTNFTHKAGSSCIGQGTAASGFAYNGSAPDQGAFETFGFSSAGITGNTLDVQLGMNLNIPVLPASGQTTWTVGCTGTGCGTRTVTAAAKKTGTDSVVSLTVDGAACTDVQTWTVTYAVGTVTDSALIGNSLNQNMTAFATQAVTNNCGAPAATGTLEQKTHQFTQSQTPGNALSAVGAANTDMRAGVSFALVTQIDCTVAACDPIGLRLYYRKNAGAYAAVPDTLGADQIAFFGNTSDPAYLTGAVSCCLSGALTPNTGTTGFTSAAVPVFTLTQNSSIVQRRQLLLGPTAVATDTYEFKEYNQTGVVLGGGYTPAAGAKITVSAATIEAPSGLHLAAQQGGNVSVTWTPSTDTALLGYRLYLSDTSGVQGDLIATVTPATAIVMHMPITTWHGHLAPGTWYFNVTQFDTGGQESPIPPELSVTAPAAIARTARTP